MTRQNSWIFMVVACIFVLIGIFIAAQRSSLQNVQLMVTSKLFGASMMDSQGKAQSLSQWRGKILLVNFWATWCNPCTQEIPELSSLQNAVTKKNIQIIGIGIDSAANIMEFSSKYKISYPLYIADTNGADLSRIFGNSSGGLPFTVLVDQNGLIKKSYLGRLKLEELKHDLELP